MNRILLLLMIITAFCMLNATTLEVSLDGSHQYTSIQSAIEVSSNGDIVLVHPGRYFENIDFIGKSITVCSEFVNIQDWSIVESTIIDGNQQSSCVVAKDYEDNAYINGFTITNGIGYGSSRYGGGIYLKNESILSVQNCLIEDNSANKSGGIRCIGWSTLNLSGNVIRNNRAVYQGGGIGIRNGYVVFDPNNLNSIYNNYGDVQDIYIYIAYTTDIILDTFSVAIAEPDGFFASYFRNTNIVIPQIAVQNSYFNQIDSDLYVSPDGDDNNDGLTPETAFQTIAYANRIVQPDSLNPNTVFLLPGTYSKELNNQFFPIALQSYSKMLGAGVSPEEVVIGDERGMNKIVVNYVSNSEVGNFTLTQADEEEETAIFVDRSYNSYLHDIDCVNNNVEYPGALVMFSNNCTFENITIRDVNHSNHKISCIKLYECDEITLNGIVVDNVVNVMQEGSSLFVKLEKSNVSVNNMIITNSVINEPGLIFQYSNSLASETGGNLELNNFLAYNNTSLSGSAPMINITSYHDESYLNNMTIAYNEGPTAITRFSGDYTIRNSIIYNPDGGYEMSVWIPSDGDPTPLWSNIDIDYSLVRNGLNGVAGATNPGNNVIWGSSNIDANPLFRGDVEGDIPVGDPRWLQLTPNSPCVDTGTPDTLGMNLPNLDITGNPRVWDNIIDMGAHEYNSTVDNNEHTQSVIVEQIVVSHFPNPITPNGTNGNVAFIEFALPKKPVEKPILEIYNIKGQKIRSIKITQSFSQLVRSAGLSSEDKQSGEYYSQVWDCKDNNRKLVSSGIYFYKVSSSGHNAIGKMMIIK